MKKITCVLILVLILSVSCKSNSVGRVDYKDETPYMYGMVYDYDNRPVEGTQIFIGEELITTSDVQGRFILDCPNQENEVVLIANKTGYECVETKITYDPINVLYIRLINTQQLLSLAEENINKMKYSQAEDYLVRALKLSPDREDVIYLLSIALYKQGKYTDALTNLEKLNNSLLYKKYIEELKKKIEKKL